MFIKKDVLLSIIVPFYNAEKFLKTSITSVLRQNADWAELVLVNDGSSDNSEALCKSFDDPRINYICFSPNQGAGHARNTGVEKASGKWIIFLDADDMLLGDFLCDELKKFLDSKLDDTDFIYTPIISSDINLEKEPTVKFPEKITEIKGNMPSLEFVTGIYKKEFLVKNSIKFYEYQAQDIESAYRFQVFSKAKNVYVAQKLFYYVRRVNPVSNMHTNHIVRLSEIKGKVFFDLYTKCDKNDNESCAYLYSTFLRQLRKLFTFSYENGGLAKKELFDLVDLFKKSWNEAKRYDLDSIEVEFIKKFRLYLPFINLLLKRNPQPEKQEPPVKREVPTDNTNELLERLDIINKTFKNNFDF